MVAEENHGGQSPLTIERVFNSGFGFQWSFNRLRSAMTAASGGGGFSAPFLGKAGASAMRGRIVLARTWSASSTR